MATTHSNGKKREPVMRVHHVGKRYSRNLKHALWYGVRDIAREVLLRREQTEGWNRAGEFWAVSEITFDLHPGDALALIGPNGAGKSTLLKMLSGLIKPDTGRIHVHGRTGALIELGAGFDPVLSGRENIMVSAAVLGFNRAEIATLLPQIVAFSELEEVIDTPVKYYSSGMNARLAFSVAAHLNPTVFLVDEVLAVGDIDFQRKCINHMLHYLSGGGALILVSHSPYLIQSVCNRGIYINGGRIQYAGTAVDALNVYLKNPAAHAVAVAIQTTPGIARREPRTLSDAKPVAIDQIAIEHAGGGVLATSEPARVKIKFRALREIDIFWGFTVMSNDQWVCITGAADMEMRRVKAGEQELSCLLPKLSLVEGTYMLKVGIMEGVSRQPLDLFGWEDAPLAFQVHSPVNFLNNAFKALNQLVTVDVVWEK